VPYDELVLHLTAAMEHLVELGMNPPRLEKGKVGEYIIANSLGCDVVDGGAGDDLACPDGFRYEAKYSHSSDNFPLGQFNFNIGRWVDAEASDARLEGKFGHLRGAYLGLSEEGHLTKILLLPMNELLPHLKEHCRGLPEGNTHQIRGNLTYWEERIHTAERIEGDW